MLRLLGFGSNPAGEESSGAFHRTGPWRRTCRVRGGQDSADEEGQRPIQQVGSFDPASEETAVLILGESRS
jgi:hypothetical protein